MGRYLCRALSTCMIPSEPLYLPISDLFPPRSRNSVPCISLLHRAERHDVIPCCQIYARCSKKENPTHLTEGAERVEDSLPSTSLGSGPRPGEAIWGIRRRRARHAQSERNQDSLKLWNDSHVRGATRPTACIADSVDASPLRPLRHVLRGVLLGHIDSTNPNHRGYLGSLVPLLGFGCSVAHHVNL